MLQRNPLQSNQTVVELRSLMTDDFKMPRVTVYSTAHCGFCSMAKTRLDQWDIPFEEIRMDNDAAMMKQFAEVTNGARTVPQIIIDGKPIGGYSELTELHMDGELDELMEAD